MGFVKDVAMAGLSPGLALLTHKNKKPASLVSPQPTMYSNTPYSKPMSMIGSSRGDY